MPQHTKYDFKLKARRLHEADYFGGRSCQFGSWAASEALHSVVGMVASGRWLTGVGLTWVVGAL